MAAARNESLAESTADVTATEVRATGAHQNYSPTCDVARDPRWGRTFETFGESPYLCGELAAAKVRGYQGDDLGASSSVIATAKHFPAYGEPVRGEDASPAEVSEYALRNVFVPPFVEALEAGVASAMPAYNATNGEPAHGSRHLLTEYLRGELGFDGTIVSDWNGVRMLHDDHRVTADHRDSVRRTREAGLDLASVDAVAHAEHYRSLVEDGELSESLLDESVRRVLRLKFELGLFEDPFVDATAADTTVGADEHRQDALEAARQSMTLLSNDGSLPLDADADILVAGPNADNPINQLGGWSVPEPEGTDVVTIRDAIESMSTGTVSYERGAGIAQPDDIDAAVAAAETADVAVVALGENWYLHEFGPNALSGTGTDEFPNRTALGLPDAQRELVEAIDRTGTPVVGVLVTGRPLAVNWLAEHAAGLLMAYYPERWADGRSPRRSSGRTIRAVGSRSRSRVPPLTSRRDSITCPIRRRSAPTSTSTRTTRCSRSVTGKLRDVRIRRNRRGRDDDRAGRVDDRTPPRVERERSARDCSRGPVRAAGSQLAGTAGTRTPRLRPRVTRARRDGHGRDRAHRGIARSRPIRRKPGR